MTLAPPTIYDLPVPGRLIDALDAGQFKHLAQLLGYSFQVCDDMAVMNLIGAVCTATNGKFAIQRANGHTEPGQLYGLVLGNPGEGKSPLLKWIKRPLLALVGQDIYFEHAMPTALIEALHRRCGILNCHVPEARALDLFGRRDFAQSILNNAYDSEPIALYRSKKDPIKIEKPSTVIFINAQPEKGFSFGRQRHVTDSGLLARFLFLLAQPLAGWREVDTPPIAKEWSEYYDDLISRLLIAPLPIGGQRHMVSLSQAADHQYVNFARDAEAALRPGCALSFDPAWGSKIRAKVLRLALVLHCVEHRHPAQEAISERTMQQAIAMMRVFIRHAQEFYFHVEHGAALEAAEAIKRWAAINGFRPFTAREAKSALPSHRQMIDAGIRMLEQRGEAGLDFFLLHESQPRRGRPNGPYYRVFPSGR